MAVSLFHLAHTQRAFHGGLKRSRHPETRTLWSSGNSVKRPVRTSTETRLLPPPPHPTEVASCDGARAPRTTAHRNFSQWAFHLERRGNSSLPCRPSLPPSWFVVRPQTTRVRTKNHPDLRTKLNTPPSDVELTDSFFGATSNTPDPDGVPLAFVRHAWDKLLAIARCLSEACLRPAYFPSAFKQATVVTLSKPGRDPRSYKGWRPITLLSVFGEGIERLFQRRITLAAILIRRYPPGCLQGCSIEDQHWILFRPLSVTRRPDHAKETTNCWLHSTWTRPSRPKSKPIWFHLVSLQACFTGENVERVHS